MLSNSNADGGVADGYRNPSPPFSNSPSPSPEQQSSADPEAAATTESDRAGGSDVNTFEDTIGDTIFRKTWILSLLVRTVESVASQVPSNPKSDVVSNQRTSSRTSMMDSSLSEEFSTGCCDMNEKYADERRNSLHSNGSHGNGDRNTNGMDGDGNSHGNGRVSIGGMDDEYDSVGGGDVSASGEGCDGNNTSEVYQDEGGGDGSDMDAKLEEDLCFLWDASVNTDVAEFLQSQHCVDLFLGVAIRSSSLRLTEIVIGILGNMACIPAICMEALCDKDKMDAILTFLGSEDQRILIETTRLILMCLSHKEVRTLWLEHISSTQNDVLSSLTFVLQSSTNDDLLKNTAALMDKVLYNSPVLLRCWASDVLVGAICEAVEQTSSSSQEVSISLLVSLQLLTTFEEGVGHLVSHEEKLTRLSFNYLRSLDYMDDTHFLNVLAVTSLLEVLRKHSRKQEVVVADKDTLAKILSEITNMESIEIEHNQVLELRRILQTLIDSHN